MLRPSWCSWRCSCRCLSLCLALVCRSQYNFWRGKHVFCVLSTPFELLELLPTQWSGPDRKKKEEHMVIHIWNNYHSKVSPSLFSAQIRNISGNIFCIIPWCISGLLKHSRWFLTLKGLIRHRHSQRLPLHLHLNGIIWCQKNREPLPGRNTLGNIRGKFKFVF